MNSEVPINSIVSNSQLESCFEGSTSIDLVRDLLKKCQYESFVDVEDFADQFAYSIRHFIAVSEGEEEYDIAYQNNYDWGWSIADNINALLEQKYSVK